MNFKQVLLAYEGIKKAKQAYSEYSFLYFEEKLKKNPNPSLLFELACKKESILCKWQRRHDFI